MNEKYFIYIAIAGIVILTLGVMWYYRLEIKKKLADPKFKEFVHQMMLQAEEYFNSGEGQKKFDWVLDCAMTWLHLSPNQADIAKELVKVLIQKIFDENKVETVAEDGKLHTTLK